jgi:hypothetical protein
VGPTRRLDDRASDTGRCEMVQRFEHRQYLIRRQVLKLFGGAFRVYDPTGRLVLFADLKAFRLKEDIRVYSDEAMQTELLTIKARQVLDFSAAYDVVDSTTGEKVGALKRRGLKSLARDEWILMDAEDEEVGAIREDSALLALVRRLLSGLIPQSFHAERGGRPVCTYRQHFNPFVLKLDVDFSPDSSNTFDRRLGLAAGLLLCAIEKRQG